MAGQIRRLIDDIIRQRAGNNEILIKLAKTRLVLKGIDSDKFTSESTDDPEIIAKLETYAKQHAPFTDNS